MANETIQFIINAQDNATKVLQKAQNELIKVGNSVESIAGKFKNTATIFGGTWDKAVEGSQIFATSLGVAGAVAGGYIATATLTAARTETLGVAMKAIAKATGTSTKVLDEQEKILKKQGITTQEARGILTLFMQSQLDVADASKIARVAQDMAVISGQNSSDAARTLTEAIASQEPMLLRQFGIVKNLPDVYKEYGDTLGLVTETTDKNGKVGQVWSRELTQTEKKQAMLNTIMEAGTKVAGAYEDAMETAGKKLTSLPRYFQEAANSVGSVFLPMFGKLIDGLTEFLKLITPENIQIWINKIKEMQTPIMIISGAILGALTPAIFAAVVAFGALMVSLAPFMLVGAAIGGLVAGVIWVVQNWEMIQTKATEIWGGIATYLSETWTGITIYAQEIWGGITSFFQGIWEGIKTVFSFGAALAVGAVIEYFNFFGIDIVQVFQTIITALQQAWIAIRSVFSSALNAIKAVWKAVWTAIGEFLSPIWEAIKEIVVEAWEWIADKFSELSKPIIDLWTSMWSGFGSVVTTIWTEITNSFKSGINFIIKGINTVINALNFVANKGGSALGMKAISIPTIPMLAQGGIVTRPTIAMIGEAGAEAVVPLNNANNFGVGGKSINITITGNHFIGEKDFATKISEILYNKLNLELRV